MSALATVADLEKRLGRPVDDVDQAQSMLDDVSAVVRAYTGQQFTRAITTERLRVRRGLVKLPQRPVNDVAAVTADGTAVSFDWYDGAETLCTTGAELSCSRVAYVSVTYDHGYDVVPPDVVAVVCNVAMRGLGTDLSSGAVTQRMITNYQESFGPVGASGPTGLFTSESAVLDRYRRVGTVAWVGV